MRSRTIVLAACAVLAVVTAACGFDADPTKNRISGPPDTGVTEAAGPPADGILAEGGLFRLAEASTSLAECDQKPIEDPFDMIQDPFGAEGEQTTKVPLGEDKAAGAGPFLESLLLQSSTIGTTAVFIDGLDPTQSLPWAGNVLEGRDDRFLASALNSSIGDRTVDLDVKIPHDVAADAVDSAPGEYTLTWRESPSLPAWLGEPGPAGAICVVEGEVTLLRTGPAPQRPSRPSGPATVRSADPPPSGVGADALAAVGVSTWQSTDTNDISLVSPGGAALATGQYLLSGDAWVFEMKSSPGQVEFVLRAWKAEEGTVRGTLLAGGGESFLELSG